MADGKYPPFFADRLFPHKEALKLTITSNSSVASGFATSEPVSFYSSLWDHIQEEDITDLTVRNGLFMAPHKFCIGDTLSARGKLEGWSGRLSFLPGLARTAGRINQATQKLDGLARLVSHYEERKERRILGVSGFIGPADNIVIPDNLLTRYLYPEYAGRNSTRIGLTDMHAIHFPDAYYSLGYDPDTGPMFDTFVTALTPPNQDGEMSLGPANGANGEIVSRVLRDLDARLLVYLNPKYPFTRGYGDARNTWHIGEFKALAEAGKLFVVEDDGPLPALPADSFKDPSPAELKIAENLVNHIEMNKELTSGRAIQVGIGGTGVLAIKALKDSSWTGREYSEMLEPFTVDLFEAGKIDGTHFIEQDGRRTRIDGKLVCTFSICEANSDFYKKIHDNDAIIMAPASRVVIPEGFQGGLGINNILGIDFNGHINNGARYRNWHSGIGGAAMINRGLAKGGVAYLCLKSTHKTPEGKRHSSIFPAMPMGTPIGMTGPDIWGSRDASRFYLVTEHGVTRLSSNSQSKFIKSIVSVAHPDFRSYLTDMAWRIFRQRI